MKAACDELGISLIAYSPIAQGRTAFLLLNILFTVLLLEKIRNCSQLINSSKLTSIVSVYRQIS